MASTPITDERLAAAEARATAATQSPWRVDTQGYDNRTIAAYEDTPLGQHSHFLFDSGYHQIASDADFEFVAFARDDVPDFVAEIRRLRIENAALREEVATHATGAALALIRTMGVDDRLSAVEKYLSEYVPKLHAENAAMRSIVAAVAQEPRIDVPVVAQKSGIEMCALCHRIEGDDGSIDHAPDCPAVLAVQVMEGMKDV